MRSSAVLKYSMPDGSLAAEMVSFFHNIVIQFCLELFLDKGIVPFKQDMLK